MIITFNTSSRTFQTCFTLSLFLFSIILLGSSVYSWTNPSGTPPNNNVAAPINTSATSQVKSGPLQVNGLANTGSSAFTGNIGVGTSPYDPWKIVAGGGSYGIYGTATTGQGIRGYATTGYAGYFATAAGGGGVYASNGVVGTYLGYPGSSSYGVYTNGNTYAAGTVRGDDGFCIGGSCITSWPTASTPVSLGAYSGRSVGSTYTAGTDGFVVAYVGQTTDSGACVAMGYVGSSIVTSITATSNGETVSLMFPVRKGSSYSVKWQASYMTRCSSSMSWVPLD